jgi:hypothetical protein
MTELDFADHYAVGDARELSGDDPREPGEPCARNGLAEDHRARIDRRRGRCAECAPGKPREADAPQRSHVRKLRCTVARRARDASTGVG